MRERDNCSPKLNVLTSGSPVANPKSVPDYSVFAMKYIFFPQFHILSKMFSCAPGVRAAHVEDQCSCAVLNDLGVKSVATHSGCLLPRPPGGLVSTPLEKAPLAMLARCRFMWGVTLLCTCADYVEQSVTQSARMTFRTAFDSNSGQRSLVEWRRPWEGRYMHDRTVTSRNSTPFTSEVCKQRQTSHTKAFPWG
jgi:hypothetical protein